MWTLFVTYCRLFFTGKANLEGDNRPRRGIIIQAWFVGAT